jgi:hypothetical protein
MNDIVRSALETAIELLWEHTPGLAPRIESLEAALRATSPGKVCPWCAAEPDGATVCACADGYKQALEADLYGVVRSAAWKAGAEIDESQSIALAHAVMRYMGAFGGDGAPAVRPEGAPAPKSKHQETP